MKYYWPLVLIGGTLLIIAATLPWFQWSGGMPMIGQPTSGYDAGYESGGVLTAVGGVALLLMALIDRGNPESRSLALIVSAACGLVILFVFAVPRPIISEQPTYWPAFGLGVSTLGVAMGLSGSLARVSENALPDKRDMVILAAIELFMIWVGLALLIHSVLGDWLGLWHTAVPGCLCLNYPTALNDASSFCARCYATATARAIQLTPPAWWP